MVKSAGSATATWISVFLVGLVLGGCVERQADVNTDDELRQPACMILNARGYWSDGRVSVLLDEEMGTGSVCMCMTRDELVDQTHVDELNELGLAECNRIATLHGNDFDWTDCQESYEQGTWLDGVYFARDEFASFNDQGLTCDDGGGEPGCTVSDGKASPLAWGMLFAAVALGLRRRRETHSSGH